VALLNAHLGALRERVLRAADASLSNPRAQAPR
jgi:hypothetical protein